jgi:hypothetical protein
MLFYNFFDYKYNIEDFSSDLFCTAHIVYIVLVYVLGFLVSYLLRKARHDRIAVFLKVLSILALVMEIAKISWESYYDVTTGRGFNYEGLIPVYTCSLYIYTMLAAAWGRGKVRNFSLSFLTTISLLYGAIGVVYCNGLNFYPFWTFGAFYSLFFHSAMFLTGVFLLMTGFKKLEWPDAFRAMIPILLLSIIAIPLDYVMKADYMLVYSGSGVPLYQDLSEALANKGLRFVYTLIMLLTHIPLAAAVIGVYKLLGGKWGASDRS